VSAEEIRAVVTGATGYIGSRLVPRLLDAGLAVRAMARNPDARPQTMETLEYELNKCLAGRGVAVAQILGMTTDATVVASLNPGLSMRTLDDGIVRPASSPALSIPRANTNSGLASIGVGLVAFKLR